MERLPVDEFLINFQFAKLLTGNFSRSNNFAKRTLQAWRRLDLPGFPYLAGFLCGPERNHIYYPEIKFSWAYRHNEKLFGNFEDAVLITVKLDSNTAVMKYRFPVQNEFTTMEFNRRSPQDWLFLKVVLGMWDAA